MGPSAADFPSRQEVLRALQAVFAARGDDKQQVTLLRCKHFSSMSSFPSQLLTCCLEDGEELRLLCKTGAEHCQNSYGHWGGVPYEANVYHHVLQPLHLSVPRYYGAYADSALGKTFLFIEYIDNAVFLDKVINPTASLMMAVRWIGRFHAINATRLEQPTLQFLNRYDERHYRGWARRTCQYAGELHQRFRWLASLCQRFEERLDVFLQAAQTIVHGEYTMHNVLFADGLIYPVDWESAAIGMGEIDLAFLTDGWGEEVVQQCLKTYCQARWGQEAAPDLEYRFRLAQVYMHCLWLGCEPELTVHPSCRWRFKRLRAAGEQAGLIS